ncbi:MAG: CocE/NonD family hydrolase [Kaiparowitsia implicata GSE-PSE-MK54-09C]|jgi:putative CocE/NonD family hydrolase|nr:CocE/NonD family hydrolase [Kaiparowitsia implicata GSE-PSE-MK54-09C]
MLPVLPKQTQSLQTRDGVRLDADVYYPAGEGEFPVLLMRQPYGRAIASTVVYAHPTWYAAHGYIVVIQDVRGRGTSDGDFRLFAHEINDGYDTVQWAAHLPQSTGAVGMYGFSYQGMTQLYAAAAQPPALKTLCPSMVAYDLYADWAYEGGAFCYQMNRGWALQLAAETARRQGNDAAYEALYAAAHGSIATNPVCPRAEILDQLAPDSFYHDWLGNPQPDAPYWAVLSPHRLLDSVDLPMLHVGGWFDTYLRGTLKLYRAMAARSAFSQHLWVGPWAHLPWGRRVGEVDYGKAANSPIDWVQVRWFDQILKEQETGILTQPPVCLFDLGRSPWLAFPHYPNPDPTPLYLSSNGLAGMGDHHGALGIQMPPPMVLPDVLVHDPWRPVPALGGHATVPAGQCDRALLDSRTDVLTYTTAPFTTDVLLAGDLSADLYCTADAPSFDLCAVLSEVKPNDSVITIAQGYCRVEEAAPNLPPQRYRVDIQSTCIHIPRGSALRLSISGACAPAYSVNPGITIDSTIPRLQDAQVITLALCSGDDYPSRLNLPVISETMAKTIAIDRLEPKAEATSRDHP